jgi:uncharacterized protein (TIGR02246 family)
MKRWVSGSIVSLVLLAVASVAVRAQESAPPPDQSVRRDGPSSSAAAGSPDDPIRQVVAGYTNAVNQRNVASVVAFFTDDAVLIDVDGYVTGGTSNIQEQFTRGFESPSNFTLETSVDSVRFLTPEVAQVAGESKLTAPNESSIVNRYTALFVKLDGAWRIAEIRDLPGAVEDIEPYERLKELEWMIGDWVDESEGATVTSSIRWGENKAYLVRESTAQVEDEKISSSTMILAWDPRTAQIRSWLFSSEGGLGEAVWTRSSDSQWVVKATGTHRDGSPTSATQIVDVLSKDAVRTSSLDRIIGGEIAPDIEEVLMVRRPPEPGAAAR